MLISSISVFAIIFSKIIFSHATKSKNCFRQYQVIFNDSSNTSHANISQLYQYYAKRKPEDVYELLMKYKTDYIILEDSICLAPSRGGCRLPDLLDIDNGVVSKYLKYLIFGYVSVISLV